MAIFNSFLYVYQRVKFGKIIQIRGNGVGKWFQMRSLDTAQNDLHQERWDSQVEQTVVTQVESPESRSRSPRVVLKKVPPCRAAGGLNISNWEHGDGLKMIKTYDYQIPVFHHLHHLQHLPLGRAAHLIGTEDRDVLYNFPAMAWKYPLVNLHSELENHHHFSMGKSTISTGSFSIANC